MRCATCQTELEEGSEVLELQEGVLGLRGFAALDEPLVFCSVECLKNHFTGAKGYVYRRPRRVP